MNFKLDPYVIELESKIQILELENETLSAKAEENLLLNRAFEEINIGDDIENLILNALESVSVLLNIQFSGLFDLKDHQFICRKSYALFTNEETESVWLRVPEKVFEQLLNKETCLIQKMDPGFVFNFSNSGYVAEQAVIIPVKSEVLKQQVFVFITNGCEENLTERMHLFEKIVQIISAKLERVFYQDELIKLNEELEKKIDIRTEELQKQNAELIAERLRAEKNKTLHRNLVEVIPDGIYKSTDDGVFVEVNTALVTMLGYESKEELMAIDIKTQLYFHVDDRESVELKEDLKEMGVYRMKKKDGSEIWVEDHGWLTFDQDSNTLFHEGIMRDVTERRKSQTELIKLTTAVEQSANTIMITDVNGNIEYTNPKFTELTGYTADEVLGQNPHILSSGEHPKEYYTHMWQTISDGRTWTGEFHNKTKTGGLFWENVTITPVKDKDGTITNYLAVKEDNTAKKEAEQALKESEEKYRAMIETSNDLIWMLDTHGNFTFMNKQAEDATGYFIKDWMGKSFMPLVMDDELPFLQEVYVNGMNGLSDTYEFRLKIADGRVMTFSVNTAPIVIDEVVTGLVSFARDITQQKEGELKLIDALEKAEESDKLKSAFLANMSHEIRTPMNGILGFAELLKQPDLTGEVQQEYIRIIEKGGLRMLNIINDIVDISKIESNQVKISISNTNINKQMEYIYLFFNPEIENKGIDFVLKNELPAHEAFVKTDREKLYAILTNLVKNAIKYTEVGSVEFGCEIVNTDSNPMLQFFVKDTGIGIPQDRQEAVFERFIQADVENKMARQGTGLGLSISKAYVEMLGGRLWMESRENSGSTFYFTIPYNPVGDAKTMVKKNVLVGSEENQINDLKILVVEDDISSAQLLSIMLDKFAKEIIHVQSGKEAIEACRFYRDIDLILMDIQLPNMNGYVATRHIREFNTQVVIIAQTAFAMSGDKEKALEAGCNDYISKPIKKELLTGLIGKYFNK